MFKIQRMKQIKMVRKYRDGTGRARVVGSRSLTASQTYPWQFCYTVSGLFSKNMKTLKEETILSDRNLSFKDVDACSSDSELGDLLIPEGSDSE